LKKSAKRFDFGGRLGYNIANKVPMGPGGGHLNNRVVKGALFVKLKLLANWLKVPSQCDLEIRI
jgi:hypothetical protein